jgi:glycosyltransferase involved in cell wall biosynthesis
MSSPLVTIVVPAHNMELWIEGTLKSVQLQTFSNWECLVVDDGSLDTTQKRVLNFHDARFRLLSQSQQGVSVARNYGIAEAKGKFIAFLDADDIWHPRALEKMLAPLMDGTQYVLCSALSVRFEDGTGKKLPLPGTKFYRTGDTWQDLLVDNFMTVGAFVVRSNNAKSFEFDSKLRIGEDRDWLLRLLKGNKACFVDSVVHYYRQRSTSAIRDIDRFLENETRMMKKHLDVGGIPWKIKARSMALLDFHAATLLFKKEGQRLQALSRLLRALSRDLFYMEIYFRIIRKVWFAIMPAGFVEELKPILNNDDYCN